MKKTTRKTSYTSPEVEMISIRIEQGILGISGGANYSNTPGGAGGNDTIEDGGNF